MTAGAKIVKLASQCLGKPLRNSHGDSVKRRLATGKLPSWLSQWPDEGLLKFNKHYRVQQQITGSPSPAKEQGEDDTIHNNVMSA